MWRKRVLRQTEYFLETGGFQHAQGDPYSASPG
jgi:hypothetical protein